GGGEGGGGAGVNGRGGGGGRVLGDGGGGGRGRLSRRGGGAAGGPVPGLWGRLRGSARHERLGFLHNEGEEGRYRAAFCDACRGYVKMVATLAALPPLYLLLADAVTLHLDLAAAQQGYADPPWSETSPPAALQDRVATGRTPPAATKGQCLRLSFCRPLEIPRFLEAVGKETRREKEGKTYQGSVSFSCSRIKNEPDPFSER